MASYDAATTVLVYECVCVFVCIQKQTRPINQANHLHHTTAVYTGETD